MKAKTSAHSLFQANVKSAMINKSHMWIFHRKVILSTFCKICEWFPFIILLLFSDKWHVSSQQTFNMTDCHGKTLFSCQILSQQFCRGKTINHGKFLLLHFAPNFEDCIYMYISIVYWSDNIVFKSLNGSMVLWSLYHCSESWVQGFCGSH